jgi:hypothetical protein
MKINFEKADGTLEHISLQDAINRQFEWTMARFGLPINVVFPDLMKYAIGSDDRRMTRNVGHLKGVLREIIRNRRSGKSETYGGG